MNLRQEVKYVDVLTTLILRLKYLNNTNTLLWIGCYVCLMIFCRNLVLFITYNNYIDDNSSIEKKCTVKRYFFFVLKIVYLQYITPKSRGNFTLTKSYILRFINVTQNVVTGSVDKKGILTRKV